MCLVFGTSEYCLITFFFQTYFLTLYWSIIANDDDDNGYDDDDDNGYDDDDDNGYDDDDNIGYDGGDDDDYYYYYYHSLEDCTIVAQINIA